MGGLSEKNYQIRRISDSTALPSILVDSGNLLFKQAGSYSLDTPAGITAEAIGAAYAFMGFDAVAVGPADLSGGITLLQESGEKGLPWTSANLSDQQGNLLFPAYRQTQVGDYLVGLVAITDPGAAAGLDYLIGDPEKALARLLPGLSETCDIIVLLSSLPDRQTRLLAELFRQIDIVIGGDRTKGNVTPFQTGASIITQTAGRGQYLGVLTVTWRNLGWGEPPAESLTREKARLKSINWQINRLTVAQGKNPQAYDAKMRELEKERSQSAERIALLNEKINSRSAAGQFNSYQHTFVPLANTGRVDPQLKQIVSRAKKKIAGLN